MRPSRISFSLARLPTFLLLLSCGNALSAPTAVSFYRLRIDYSTTSDWTTLDIENTANILTLRLMGVKGALYAHQAEGEDVGGILDIQSGPVRGSGIVDAQPVERDGGGRAQCVPAAQQQQKRGKSGQAKAYPTRPHGGRVSFRNASVSGTVG